VAAPGGSGGAALADEADRRSGHGARSAAGTRSGVHV